MRKPTLLLGILLLAAGVGAASAELTAEDAFATLKGMAGTWRGTPEGDGPEAEAEAEAAGEVVHEIEVSAAGTVVMETMAPGTEHEMINMYHLDGDDLVLTHYCAGGNQPTMKMVAAKGNEMHFDFTGGTNLDPAVDPHIHAAQIVLVDGDTIESNWTSYAGGKEAGGMNFTLKRGE